MSTAEFLHPTQRPESVAPGTRLTPEQQAVVESNIRLISLVVKPGSPNYDDAWQDGVLGLCRAAQTFDVTKGFKFSTYAMYWIRQAVQRGNEVEGEHGRNLIRAKAQAQKDRRDFTGIRPLSRLDAPMNDDGHASTLGELLPDHTVDPEADAVSRASLAELVRRLERACKDDVDRQVLAALLRPEQPTHADIGAEVGMSYSAVRDRILRLRTRSRHPTSRRAPRPAPRPQEPVMPTLTAVDLDEHANPVTPASAAAVELRMYRCDPCEIDFTSPQGLGAHRRHKHPGAPRSGPDTAPPPPEGHRSSTRPACATSSPPRTSTTRG